MMVIGLAGNPDGADWACRMPDAAARQMHNKDFFT
jgi:hypothetical protein